jgi:hypothetical protein
MPSSGNAMKVFRLFSISTLVALAMTGCGGGAEYSVEGETDAVSPDRHAHLTR